METIDRKFRILAVNPCKPGAIYTEKDGAFFKATDEFFPDALKAYIRAMVESGRVDANQIMSAEMLLDRVMVKQATDGKRTPDIETQREIDRCIGGKGVS